MKRKLILATSTSFGISDEEQIRLFKRIGFDGFFTNWENNGMTARYRELANELDMEYQSVHAPFLSAAEMWKSEDQAKDAIDELLACLEDCHSANVPIMVVHTFIGFNDHDPNEYGIQNFRVIVDRAEELGVKIAFENTEGEEYLDCLMNAFADRDGVGFCLDTGHVMCYNRGRDMLRDYGNRLIATHINDNMGISDPDNIFWTDDLHLLPFDGIADWEAVVRSIVNSGYSGPLTFELVRSSKPNRHENDKYMQMPLEEYLKAAYSAAVRIAELTEKAEASI